ncbi:hypothetical protein ACGFZA_39115 [Streptomyces sp. NPDC048211]|uniref:hypothetical protein n=1 Tax=Streptomyces sp. NPDC048211 TaxID=3365516 RepID=UPI000A6784D0
MSHGRAVAAHTEKETIGGTIACEVDASHWANAFDTAGLPVTLADDASACSSPLCPD